MPIDYRIPLGGNPVQVNSPMQTLGRLYELQSAQAEAEARRMAVDDRRRQEADRAILGQAYSAPKLDRATAIETVTKSGAGHLVPIINKQFDEWDKAALERREAFDKARQAEQAYMGRLFAGVAANGYDPMAAFAAVDHAEAEFGPEFAPRAQEIRGRLKSANGDPKAIQGVIEEIRAQDPNYAARQTAGAAVTRAATGEKAEARAGEQFALTKPGLEAEARQKVRTDVAGQLASARNQAEYDQLLDSVAMPGWMRRLLPEKFDRDRILQVGQTPEQIQQGTDRDAARAETRRHNLTTEANAANSLKETIEEHKRVQQRAGIGGPDSGATFNRLSVVEQWHGDGLLQLQEDLDNKEITQEQYDARKKILDDTYAKALKPGAATTPPAPAPGTLGALAVPPAAATPPPAAAPSPRPNTLGASMPRPQGGPVATPPIVMDLLKGAKPGIFTLTDGSTWRKKADGSIIPFQR